MNSFWDDHIRWTWGPLPARWKPQRLSGDPADYTIDRLHRAMRTISAFAYTVPEPPPAWHCRSNQLLDPSSQAATP